MSVEIEKFENLLNELACRGKSNAGVSGLSSFLINLPDAGKSWLISFSIGTVKSVNTSFENCGISGFILDSGIVEAILAGEITPQNAFLEGRIDVVGRLSDGMRVAGLFNSLICSGNSGFSNTVSWFREALDAELEPGIFCRIMLAYSDDADRSKLLVVFPPNPEMGGDAGNKLVGAICREAAKRGLVAAAFNYRGIDSALPNDEELISYWSRLKQNNDYEVIIKDSHKVVNIVRNNFRADADLYYVGYSFGALIALSLNQLLQAERCVCVSPPLISYDFTELLEDRSRISILFSLQDEFCPKDKLTELSDSCGCRIRRLASSGHFYCHHETETAAAILEDMGLK